MQWAQQDYKLTDNFTAPKGSLIMPSLISASMQVCALPLPNPTEPKGLYGCMVSDVQDTSAITFVCPLARCSHCLLVLAFAALYQHFCEFVGVQSMFLCYACCYAMHQVEEVDNISSRVKGRSTIAVTMLCRQRSRHACHRAPYTVVMYGDNEINCFQDSCPCHF